MLDKVTKGGAATKSITIPAPKFQTCEFRIRGTAPYCQNKFSNKAIETMMEKMAAGAQARSKKVREARDYDQDCLNAMHLLSKPGAPHEPDGPGIPASAFRIAMISACRLVGFKMTLAKLSVFIEADGLDYQEGTPLVRIEGDWERFDAHVRNATGVVDIHVRPLWREWSAKLRVRFDLDQFSIQDATNLLQRASQQVGIGEGRPDSRSSAGMGFGLFEIEGEAR